MSQPERRQAAPRRARGWRRLLPAGRTGGACGAILAALLLLLPFQASRAELVDRIAAVVNDEVITLREVRRAAAPALAALSGVGNASLLEHEERRAMKEALDDLIGQILIMQSAEELKVTASNDEVDDYIAQIKGQYGWDDAAMDEALQREGTTAEEFRKDVKRRLTTSRLVQIKLGSSVRVSEDEVSEALKREYSALATEKELTARHILLLVPEGGKPEDVEKVKQRAMDVLRLAREPGADFAALAKQYSEGPGAANGGEIGSFTRGMLDPAFEKAAFSADVGEVVGPVRTRYGYHVIQVTRSRELEPKDEEELRKEVRNRLRQEAMERAMKRWILDLRRKAFVDVKLWPEDAPEATPADGG